MTETSDTSDSEYAGLNPLSDNEALEDEDGPEASTVDSGGGPNEGDDPTRPEPGFMIVRGIGTGLQIPRQGRHHGKRGHA